MIRVPENGGNTNFSHQGAAYDALPKDKQELFSSYISVNSNSGVVHPMVHNHWISGRRSIWLHAQMTGAVMKMDKETNSIRLLDEDEMFSLFSDY
jgi:taurine dioxygenase